MEGLWVELCSAQVSLFMRKEGAWVASEIGEDWIMAVVARSDDCCRIRIGEDQSQRVDILLSAASSVSLASADFAEIKTNASSSAGNTSGRFGMYFIDGDEASTFVSLVCSAVSALKCHGCDENRGSVQIRQPCHSSGAAGGGRSHRRKSLSQFPEVNEAVDHTLVSADNGGSADYSGAVSGLLGRVANSATGMLKQLSVSNIDAQGDEDSESVPSSSVAVSPLPGAPSVFPFAASAEANAAQSSGAAASSTTKVESGISAPQVVKHDVKVSYDFHNARYVGLPAAWKDMNRCFGLGYDACTKVRLESYESRIPAVLEMLKRHFLQLKGAETVGIFRLSADKEKVDRAKAQINSGDFEGCEDVHVVSNLIKLFFREMPKSLLNSVPERSIHQVADTVLVAADEKCYDTIAAHMETFPEPHRSLFYWLLDLMCLVTLHEATNKMGCKNIAIVLSPNLYSVNTENAMYALTMSQKVADFTTKCLAVRLKQKHSHVAST